MEESGFFLQTKSTNVKKHFSRMRCLFVRAQGIGFDRIGCCWNNTLPLCPNDVQLPRLITQLELRAQIFVRTRFAQFL